MSNEYLLGLDNGGSLIKAALFDRAGNQIACESIPTPQDCPSTGFCQRTPESICKANFAVIRRLTDTYGDKIAALGIAGHGNETDRFYPLSEPCCQRDADRLRDLF